MADKPTDAPVAAKTKRSFFKKAAWQTKPKAEGEKEEDMFSHSNKFNEFIAADIRRKRERERELNEKLEREREQKDKLKSERELKDKLQREEDRRQKRRKTSSESMSPKPLIANNVNGEDLSESPSSPTRKRKTKGLSEQYEALTKSSSSLETRPSPATPISDYDADSRIKKDPPAKASSLDTIPYLPSKPAPSILVDDDDDLQELEDPRLAALAAEARAKAARRAKQSQTESDSTSHSREVKAPIVRLFIQSDIPNTSELIVSVRTDMTLEKAKKAWCDKNNFPKEVAKTVFFTWKGRELAATTRVERLGFRVDSNGLLTVEGSSAIFDGEDRPLVHVVAWTPEAHALKKRKDEEEEARKTAASETPITTPEASTPIAKPQEKGTKIILKAKGKQDYRLVVKADTTFEKIASIYKLNHSLPETEPITLMFDGDRLRPMDTVADSEIDDMDVIEVHFK